MRIFDFVFSLIFIINILYGSSLPNFNTSDKDKLLIEIISYVIDKGHYSPKEMDDDFSKNVFNSYLETIDGQHRYYLKSDINSNQKNYEKLIDQAAEEISNFVDKANSENLS